MSKSSFRAKSFQERRADFSMRIKANGRMDILPAHAKETEMERREITGTIARLHAERERLNELLRITQKGTQEWQDLHDTHCRVSGNLGHLKKTLMGLKNLQYAEVFEFAANQILTEETLQAIRALVWELWGKTTMKEGSLSRKHLP